MNGSTNIPSAQPQITAVIPAFNRARTIGRAIESVLAQTYQPAEIIVIDDGSVDGTADVVAAHSDRVRYVFQTNAGASHARNRGVERAGTPWVAFLDSDDFWLAGHLEAMSEAIIATGGAASFYFADTRLPDPVGGGRLFEASGFAAPDLFLLLADGTDSVMRSLQPMMLQSSVFSRERYLEVGGLWPALRTRHDTHMFLLLGIGQPVGAVSHCGVQMTADDQSGQRLTAAFGPATRDWWSQTRLMYADVLNHFPELDHSHSRELRARLATAHLRLGQHDWRSRELRAALAQVLHGMRVAPGHLAGRVAGRLARIWRRSPEAATQTLVASTASEPR